MIKQLANTKKTSKNHIFISQNKRTSIAPKHEKDEYYTAKDADEMIATILGDPDWQNRYS